MTPDADALAATKEDTFAGISGGGGYIGNRATPHDRCWVGNLADVAIWDTILSPTEIKAIYEAADFAWYTKANTPITEPVSYTHLTLPTTPYV